MAEKRNAFDPAQLGDPVAMQTSWTYATKGPVAGADFRTHKLVEINSARQEFRATPSALLFNLLFLVGPLAAFAALLYTLATGQIASCLGPVARILLAVVTTPLFAIMGLIGWAMFYSGTTPIVFDKLTGFFWKGRKSPQEEPRRTPLTESARLEDIHALQLVSTYLRGGRNSYYCHELNLVLHDGRRIHVVAHGDDDKLREDTRTLSAFLEKPVWDAIKT